ncbi:hypothetical protein ABOM_004594 [Aspergillus bombycis]|uniref:Uncharacterized protein n=1 Tax=Aspergillus bombycis TaxID=109264 RepID=A0A1F8A474_9EURO|nr:hypothetical protein ABOM_004594 [Aspergillus bombycis]OGM46542.1 hypothetical protein ABOM_004594 [Aspergillus bombycis]
MKIISALLPLVLLRNVATAAPLNQNSELEVDMSPHGAGLALASLEKRADCHRILNKVYAAVTSAGFIIFVNGVTGITKRVCKIEGSEKCEDYADLISDGINLIWLAGAAYKHGSAAVSTGQELIDSAAGARRSVVNEDYTSLLLEGLSEYGFSYTSYENATLPASGLRARDDEPALVSRVVLRNLTSSENPRGHDVAIHHYDDGAGQLHLPTYGQSMGDSTGDSDLHKRFNGAGFKIAFTSRPTSTPNRSNEAAISKAIGHSWAQKAQANANEIIGFVKTSDKANFYYRIIPELQGFGTNYESVDVCGGMASYLVL